MATGASNEMTWSALTEAFAECIHSVPGLETVPIYADVQQTVPELPAVFVTPVNPSETLAFGSRRIFDWPVQIMLSLGKNEQEVETVGDKYALELMRVVEYIPWGVTGRIATDNRSWTISGSDIIINCSVRIHRRLEQGE